MSSGYWLDGQGSIRPCCKYLDPIVPVKEMEDWSAIPDLPGYRSLRDEIGTGKWPKGCWSCKVDEGRGVRSRRQYYDSVGLGSDDFVMEVNIGTYCNLRCRMCGPQNSSLWLADHAALMEAGLRIDQGLDFSPYQPTNDDIDRLIRHAASIKGRVLLELKGGEPLIMDQTRMILDGLAKADNSGNVKVMLVTNGTVTPSWLRAMAEKLGKLELIISIDGVDRVYDYIRSNGRFSWSSFSDSFDWFMGLPNTVVRSNVVVQNLNMHQIPDINDWLRSKGSIGVNHILLKRPLYLAANVLPDDAKNRIFDRYQDWKHVLRPSDRTVLDRMHSFMMTEAEEGLAQRFVQVSRFLDQRRSQNLFESLTHLDEWSKYDTGLGPDGTAMP